MDSDEEGRRLYEKMIYKKRKDADDRARMRSEVIGNPKPNTLGVDVDRLYTTIADRLSKDSLSNLNEELPEVPTEFSDDPARYWREVRRRSNYGNKKAGEFLDDDLAHLDKVMDSLGIKGLIKGIGKGSNAIGDAIRKAIREGELPVPETPREIERRKYEEEFQPIDMKDVSDEEMKRGDVPLGQELSNDILHEPNETWDTYIYDEQIRRAVRLLENKDTPNKEDIRKHLLRLERERTAKDDLTDRRYERDNIRFFNTRNNFKKDVNNKADVIQFPIPKNKRMSAINRGWDLPRYKREIERAKNILAAFKEQEKIRNVAPSETANIRRNLQAMEEIVSKWYER